MQYLFHNNDLIKHEFKQTSVTIDADSTYVFNVYGFSGKGITYACIVNSTYDYIIGSGHMQYDSPNNPNNTIMRCSVKNTYTSKQSVMISAIRFYI